MLCVHEFRVSGFGFQVPGSGPSPRRERLSPRRSLRRSLGRPRRRVWPTGRSFVIRHSSFVISPARLFVRGTGRARWDINGTNSREGGESPATPALSDLIRPYPVIFFRHFQRAKGAAVGQTALNERMKLIFNNLVHSPWAFPLYQLTLLAHGP